MDRENYGSSPEKIPAPDLRVPERFIGQPTEDEFAAFARISRFAAAEAALFERTHRPKAAQ